MEKYPAMEELSNLLEEIIKDRKYYDKNYVKYLALTAMEYLNG